MPVRFQPMTLSAAREVIAWRYTGDYSIYNLEVDNIAEEAQYMSDPVHHFYAIYEHQMLIGHAVFHDEARVPGGDYVADALDIGAGMRPDWTGQGNGTQLIAAILDFARQRYQPAWFRATIAAWNHRAQKATINNGFTERSRFTATKSGKPFIIFVRPA